MAGKDGSTWHHDWVPTNLPAARLKAHKSARGTAKITVRSPELKPQAAKAAQARRNVRNARTPTTYRKTKNGDFVAFGRAPVLRQAAKKGADVTVTKKNGVRDTVKLRGTGTVFDAGGQRMTYGYVKPGTVARGTAPRASPSRPRSGDEHNGYTVAELRGMSKDLQRRITGRTF